MTIGQFENFITKQGFTKINDSVYSSKDYQIVLQGGKADIFRKVPTGLPAFFQQDCRLDFVDSIYIGELEIIEETFLKKVKNLFFG